MFVRRCMLTCPWPWRVVVIVPLCLYAAQAQSQQSKQAQKSPDQDEVVRVNSHLVNFDVTVRDKKGESIFAKYIRLAGLPAGKYVAMIEARDMVTGKLVKQQASFVIAR
jgi:hypothetical protein